MDRGVTEARLDVLERRALMADKEFVSAALNSLTVDERWAYVRAMKKDFDRLNALDSKFPKLHIVSHGSSGIYELSDLVLSRELSAAERLTLPQYWVNPLEHRSLYDSKVRPFRLPLR